LRSCIHSTTYTVACTHPATPRRKKTPGHQARRSFHHFSKSHPLRRSPRSGLFNVSDHAAGGGVTTSMTAPPARVHPLCSAALDHAFGLISKADCDRKKHTSNSMKKLIRERGCSASTRTPDERARTD
jgi:hypothetical protein